MKKVHLSKPKRKIQAICGRYTDRYDLRLTDNKEKITCDHCKNVLKYYEKKGIL